MAFGRKMHHGVRPIVGKGRAHALSVADIGLQEIEPRPALASAQAPPIAGIGQLINDQDLGPPAEHEQPGYSRSDEPGAAGNENPHPLVAIGWPPPL